MKRIGIMGGTFDPVHNGHLLLGRQARSEYGLDEIWYMPSHIPPHKKDHRITDGKDRLAMLELALEGISFSSVSDFEMKREGNTYTAQTLELLKEEYPEDKFYFIIGADSLFQLETWYHPEKVMELTSLLVSGREYDRAGRTLDQQISYLKSVYGAHIQVLHNPEMNVASARIRAMAARGEDIGELVPRAVAAYIREHRLYQESR
ncbi:MAG: nicotinate-nucleotide adenylyltransferase [Lachnospiraceae bacterium]|nr:nicotinate-nucleotide adenylyltransferase [Lachnospiraceae bacterium]